MEDLRMKCLESTDFKGKMCTCFWFENKTGYFKAKGPEKLVNLH